MSWSAPEIPQHWMRGWQEKRRWKAGSDPSRLPHGLRAADLCSLWRDMVVTWHLSEALKTRLEEGPSSADTLQVGGQERASKGSQVHLEQPCCSARCDLLQGTRSRKAQTTPFTPHHPYPEQRCKITTPTWCCSRSDSVLTSNSSPTCIPLFQPHAPASHQPWHFAGSSFTTQFLSLIQQKTHPEEKPTTFSVGSGRHMSSPKGRWAPASCTEGAAAQSREQRARNHPFWQQQIENGSVIPCRCIFRLHSILWRFTLPVPARVYIQLPVLADRGLLKWNKDLFFFLRFPQKIFVFTSGHIRTQKRAKR